MAIVHKILPDGAFVAGDTLSRETAYAYPSSLHARDATRHPDRVAAAMLALAGLSPAPRHIAGPYNAKNWALLEGNET